MSVGIAAGLAACCLLVVLHLVNDATLGTRLVDLDAENNIPTWFSSGVFLMAAVAALSAAGSAAGRARWAWLSVSALSLALSLDETASLHEEAGTRLGAEPTLSLVQPLAAAAVVALLLVAARLVGRGPGRYLAAGVVVLAVSQASASVAGLALDGSARFLLETVEDLTEMLTAVMLMAAGAVGAGHTVDLRSASLAHELRAWRRGPVGPVADQTRELDGSGVQVVSSARAVTG